MVRVLPWKEGPAAGPGGYGGGFGLGLRSLVKPPRGQLERFRRHALIAGRRVQVLDEREKVGVEFVRGPVDLHLVRRAAAAAQVEVDFCCLGRVPLYPAQQQAARLGISLHFIQVHELPGLAGGQHQVRQFAAEEEAGHQPVTHLGQLLGLDALRRYLLGHGGPGGSEEQERQEEAGHSHERNRYSTLEPSLDVHGLPLTSAMVTRREFLRSSLKARVSAAPKAGSYTLRFTSRL